MSELHTSEDICEALVRHVEVSGSEIFEKNFIMPDGKVGCSVWCIVGKNAEAFRDMACRWLAEEGFILEGHGEK